MRSPFTHDLHKIYTTRCYHRGLKGVVVMHKKDQRKKQQIQLIGLAIAAVLLVVIIMFFNGQKPSNLGKKASNQLEGDLIIEKSEITETAKFYPYQVGDVQMEVLAVKAPDGTIRTAFNTCQVCFGSGRGYYKQEGKTLVCQNCGNRFSLDDVEKVRGGCNPVPILENEKQEDDSRIIIPEELLKQYKVIFENWKDA